MPATTSGDANPGKLCWLHLSDIHFWAKNNWRDESARRKLLALLEERFAAGKLPRPDLVFCTGDIAQGETAKGAMLAQYAEAKAFFDRVLDICGLPKDRLYVVPGNHDVNRSRVSGKFQSALVGASLKEIANDWASANADYQQAIARLADYAQFVKDYLPHQEAAAVDEHGRQCYSRILNIHGIQLGIAGFNSAWTSFDDNDQNRLWLAAEWQFNQADGALDGNTDLRIGMMHHPTSWLQMDDATLAKQRIRAGFHFWLHGHEHQAWVMPTDKEIVISAGAVNADSAPEFGINLVQLDLSKGKGKVHLFSYKAGANAWLICPDGDAPEGVREIACAKIRQQTGRKPKQDKPQQEKPQQEAINPSATKKDGASTPEAEPPAPTPPEQADAARLQHARTQLLRWLAQADFAGIGNLTYADDGLPEPVSAALQARPGESMAKIADRTIDAVLNIARTVGKAQIESASFAVVAKRKAHLRHCLINAMQQAILLAARPFTQEEQAALAAFRANHPAELDVMSWLSICVLTRDELARHLQVQVRPGDHPVFKESGLTEYPEEVEAGLFDPNSDGGAKLHAMTMAHRQAFPVAATFPKKPGKKIINELTGELKRRKKDGNAIITTIAKSSGASSQEFIQWLKDELHLGVVLITENDGIFELVEGEWQSSLAHLYSALQTFEDATP